MRQIARGIFLIVNFAAMSRLHALHWRLDWLGYLIVAAILSFIAIVVHELGHAAAVARLGGTVHKIVAMPFELRLHPRRLGLAAGKGRDIGGYVTYSFDRRGTSRKEALVAAAGPAANFLFAALIAFVAIPILTWWMSPAAVPRTMPVGFLPSDAEIDAFRARWAGFRTMQQIVAMLGALALLSLGMGIANLIPFKGSDGSQIRRVVFAGRQRPRN